MFARLFVILAFAVGTSAAVAGVITNDPNLPPNVGGYVSPAQVHACYPNCATIDLSNILHSFFTNVVRIAVGPHEQEDFDSVATGQVSQFGGPPQPISLAGPVRTLVLGKVGNVTGTFQTEMLTLNLTGGGVIIRESPTLASTGQTTIANIGGGQFQIDSFFDIFTELSLDNGQTWIPSEGSTRVNLTAIPEPGAGSLAGIALAMIVLLRAKRLLYLRRLPGSTGPA